MSNEVKGGCIGGLSSPEEGRSGVLKRESSGPACQIEYLWKPESKQPSGHCRHREEQLDGPLFCQNR